MTRMLSYPVKPGGLSDRDREAIFEMAERGLTCGPIARRLSKHPATVRWFMFRNGLVAPSRRSSMPTDHPNRANRKGYAPDEDAFILALRLQSIGLSEIARLATLRFGHPRSAHGISVRLVMLAAGDTLEGA